MYWDIEIDTDEEDRIIRKVAEKIHERGLNTVGMILFESLKPLSYFGAQMGHFLVSPYLSMLGDDFGFTGGKLLRIFEKRENLEKLVNTLDKLAGVKKQKEMEMKIQDSKEKSKSNEAVDKKGWRRYIPF